MSVEGLLESVFDSLEDGILVLGRNLAPLWMNRSAGRLLSLDPVVARQPPGQTVPTIPTALKEFIGRLGLTCGPDSVPRAADGKTVHRLQLARREGGEFPAEIVLAFGRFEDGPMVTISIRDMSIQQEMEKAIYDSRKMQAIGALSGGIAHDFNNILTAVISQIDLVLYGGELPSNLRQHLIHAQTSARRGAELVGKLQAFSRQSPPSLAVVDLSEVVDQAVFMLRRSVTPLIQIQPPDPASPRCLVKVDANQLIQVILNIGINARDAMPKGGTLSLTLFTESFSKSVTAPRRAGEFAGLRIRDTGFGMPPEVLARIFEPYFSTKDLSRGPGLGLSIAASVIAEHAGWIEVASEPGQGASFSIFLPRSDTPEPPRPVRVAETRPAEGKERILVVDDDELVRMVTKAVLSYRGYQVVEAGDGEEAVQKYAETNPPYDLVLMDLHMPRLNGYDALKRIRELNPRLKAILLSGGTQDPSSLGGEIEGVAYLQKPFDNQELAGVVRRLLDA